MTNATLHKKEQINTVLLSMHFLVKAMAAKVTAKYALTKSIAEWGRTLGYAKSTFSRLHRDYIREGLTSEEFILKMIRKAESK
jgi:pyruvate/2-oxoglutarate dehydrogenase complex dihydrolipoamide acyltransferase (E2) component